MSYIKKTLPFHSGKGAEQESDEYCQYRISDYRVPVSGSAAQFF
jgi:hypothetical protein